MRNQKALLRDALTAVAITLAVIVSLPLLGVAVFVLRFVLVGVAAVLLLAALVGVMIPRLRRRMSAAVERQVDYKGLLLATDVGMSPSHAWARVEEDGAFVGVDDVVQACVGPVDRIELPTSGTRVARGQPLFALRHDARRLDVLSPVEGEVINANGALKSDPQRINRDPFGLGWVARLRLEDPRKSWRALMRGSRAQEWFRREVDRLLAMVGAGAETVPTLPDGGMAIDGLHRVIDDPTWERLRDSLLGPDPDTRKEEES
jgi:glycine cleavage system H protein